MVSINMIMVPINVFIVVLLQQEPVPKALMENMRNN
jgi:hypothetical protein